MEWHLWRRLTFNQGLSGLTGHAHNRITYFGFLIYKIQHVLHFYFPDPESKQEILFIMHEILMRNTMPYLCRILPRSMQCRAGVIKNGWYTLHAAQFGRSGV